MIEFIIVLVFSLISFIGGLFVLFRNSKNILNRTYFILVISLIVFSVANYLSLNPTNRLILAKIVMSSSSVIIASVYYMVLYFNNQSPKYKKLRFLGVVFVILISILDLTNLVFSGITKTTNPMPIVGPGIFFYVIEILGFLFATVFLLIRRAINSSGIKKLQYIYIIVGMSSLILLPITALYLPLVKHNDSLIFLSPIYSLFFITMIGYAIVRVRLFDIRIIIIRSIVYVSIISFLIVVFVTITFVVSDLIFHVNVKSSFGNVIFNGLAMIFLALIFPRLKLFFDGVSDKFFYRDTYDVQAFYDDLNKILISTHDLTKLSRQITGLIDDNIKPIFSIIEIGSDNYIDNRLMGDVRQVVNEMDMDQILLKSSYLHYNMIIADYLGQNDEELKELMLRNNIAIIIKLNNNVNKALEKTGNLILGPKKSGNQYNNKDIRVLDIISKEIFIAIQNALQFEEIENFNLTLQQKIDDATRKLRKSNEKLKALDESKDDFISMASHQLRTPLTSVKGYMSIVLDEDVGKINEMQRKMLNQAFFSAQRMVYLIADLLNVSRLKTGKFVIEPKTVNLANMIEEEMSQLLETAKSKDLTLTYEKPKNFPDIVIDETKTRQVIMNYIDNAVYYTPKGGKIEVILTNSSDTIEFKVVDNGIGVPKNEQHHLFTKFYRANNARKVRPDGTGLGLFMAKKVIVAEGGVVLFDSQENKGSTFGFMFAKNKVLAEQKS
jgi:signal transduction histidine kinase